MATDQTPLQIAKLAGVSGEAMPLIRDDLQPPQCVEALTKAGLYVDAIRFAAFTKDGPGAVTWGCAVLRALAPPGQDMNKDTSLTTSEAWLKAPEDANRRAAKQAADDAGLSRPSDLIALGVFFSGGSITDADAPPTEAPPNIYNKLIAEAVQLAVVMHAPEQQQERFKKAIALSQA